MLKKAFFLKYTIFGGVLYSCYKSHIKFKQSVIFQYISALYQFLECKNQAIIEHFINIKLTFDLFNKGLKEDFV